MSFKKLVKKIESSSEFKKFKKEHPKALPYSAFFMLRQSARNLIIETRQLNYFLGDNKVAIFSIDEQDNVQYRIDELEPSKDKKRKFSALKKDIKVDLPEIEKLILKQIKKQNEIGEVSKIIVILQEIDNKLVWNITCLIGLQMLRIRVDMRGKILESKKDSIMSMIKIDKGKKK